jgi:hypothetical protein
MNVDPLSFTLEWLIGAADKADETRSLAVCDQGHLLVSDRSCWKPRAFTADLKALICDPMPLHIQPTDE